MSDVPLPTTVIGTARFYCDPCAVIEVHPVKATPVCWLCGAPMVQRGINWYNGDLEPELHVYPTAMAQMAADILGQDMTP